MTVPEQIKGEESSQVPPNWTVAIVSHLTKARKVYTFSKSENVGVAQWKHNIWTNSIMIYLSPGWTLSGDPAWKNLVWWFFWATISRNFGFHVSSRKSQAWRIAEILRIASVSSQGFNKQGCESCRFVGLTFMIWSSSMFKTWRNWDSLTPSLHDKTH